MCCNGITITLISVPYERGGSRMPTAAWQHMAEMAVFAQFGRDRRFELCAVRRHARPPERPEASPLAVYTSET